MTGTSTAVLFICASNTGKSVMAQGLIRHIAGPTIRAASAGTHATPAVNALSAQALAEAGVDISEHHPTRLIAQMIDDADVLDIVGSQA